MRLALLAAALVSAPLARAVDASDLAQLVGFTITASAKLTGDYYGVDAGKPIELENGMAFTLESRFSTYSYRPVAVVFARAVQKGAESGNAAAYKLLVQDRIYNAKRVK